MARTKQTARKAVIQQVPRKRLVAQALGRRTNQEESEQEIEEIANTQQFTLKFDDQQKCEENAVEHKMIRCKGCEAYYTRQSDIVLKAQYSNQKNSKQLSDEDRQKFLDKHENVWICEFCLQHNNIPAAYRPPAEDNPCLILSKAKKGKAAQNENNKMLIFCIDISGSMDYVFQGKSRLESVKEAIIDEVNRLKQEKQNIKVALITFGSYVNLVGDGKDFASLQLPSELYKDFDQIVQYVSKVKNFCSPLEKSFAPLKKIISGLSVYGSTALGPGLLSAVELASKGSIGSKVILCTDGEANVGIGGSFNMDRFTFYTQVAEYSKKKRVMVNILSLKGDNCNLKQLGKLSLATGGAIFKIDPTKLGTEFAKIVKQNVIGSESKLVVKVNKIFKICNVPADQLSKDGTTMTQDYGNFSTETQLSFQFDTIPKSEAEKIPEIDIGLYSKKKVPMQVQLEYTGRKGERFLQIVTDWRQLTDNLEDIYEGANFRLFVVSVLQRASTKIKEQKYAEANSILTGYWSLVKEKFEKTETRDELDRFAEKIKKLERILGSKMRKKNAPPLRLKGKQKSKKTKSKASKKDKKRSKSSAVKQDEESEEADDSRSLMASDSEEEALYQNMRARERSRSASPERSREKKVAVPPAPTKATGRGRTRTQK